MKKAFLITILAASLANTSFAQASDQPVRIQEVMAGANGDSRVQFLVLEQETVSKLAWGPQHGESYSRARLLFFDAADREVGRFDFPSDPPSGGTTDVLVATRAFAGLENAPAPDIEIPPLLVPHNGKVCFAHNPKNPNAEPVRDCLSYGSFRGDTEGAGRPAPPLPILNAASLRRNTNEGRNSDFVLTNPAPRNRAGRTFPIRPAPLGVQGDVLFNNETFQGNGRTCASCHPPEAHFRLTPADVQSRFAALVGDLTYDPLFIAETAPSGFDAGFDFNLNELTVAGDAPADNGAPCTGELRGLITSDGDGRARVLTRISPVTYLVYGGVSPPLTGTVTDGVCNARVAEVVPGDLGAVPGSGVAGLEDPWHMRGNRSARFPEGRALILENIDGFDKPPVFRKSPHLRNVAATAPLGQSGDHPNLTEFIQAAVRQHLSRSLAREEGGANPDFRMPTQPEIVAMTGFMLQQRLPAGSSRDEFRLDRFVVTDRQLQGWRAFSGSAKCSLCHGGLVLAETTAPIQGKPVGVNAAFDIGIVDLPANGSCTPGRGICGTREFSTPQLFNVKHLAPYFHDNSALTLFEAVDFYNTRRFNDSPAGRAIGGISMTPETTLDIIAFLEGLGTPPVAGDAGIADPDE